jgi:hypothetical protein
MTSLSGPTYAQPGEVQFLQNPCEASDWPFRRGSLVRVGIGPPTVGATLIFGLMSVDGAGSLAEEGFGRARLAGRDDSVLEDGVGNFDVVAIGCGPG